MEVVVMVVVDFGGVVPFVVPAVCDVNVGE